MPIHDWTRVDAGLFHAFHHGWIEELARALLIEDKATKDFNQANNLCLSCRSDISTEPLWPTTL